MWKVELTGEDTQRVYIYRIDAAHSELVFDVEMSAYREHGQLYHAGKVDEMARPIAKSYRI